jgi:hypothetical protein
VIKERYVIIFSTNVFYEDPLSLLVMHLLSITLLLIYNLSILFHYLILVKKMPSKKFMGEDQLSPAGPIVFGIFAAWYYILFGFAWHYLIKVSPFHCPLPHLHLDSTVNYNFGLMSYNNGFDTNRIVMRMYVTT